MSGVSRRVPRPGLQRIMLLDAFAAIGWEEIRRLESPLFDMMAVAIGRAVDEGRIARRPPGPLAHFLFGRDLARRR